MHPLRERWWIGQLQAGGDLRPLKKAGQATTVTCRADRNLHRHAIWCMLSSMKDVLWMGSSKADWDAFPESVKDEAGYQLDRIQRGAAPGDWKPMKNIGSGVCALRIRDAAGAFRVICIATQPEGIYMPSCVSEEDANHQSARHSPGAGSFQEHSEVSHEKHRTPRHHACDARQRVRRCGVVRPCSWCGAEDARAAFARP
ncbi:type II toxin-antitoxin system RelE/ParE family toxin [Rhodanobacter lindaniclasticus]